MIDSDSDNDSKMLQQYQESLIRKSQGRHPPSSSLRSAAPSLSNRIQNSPLPTISNHSQSNSTGYRTSTLPLQPSTSSPIVFKSQTHPGDSSQPEAPFLDKIHRSPRAGYDEEANQLSITSVCVAQKRKLLISDLDNTLYAPGVHCPSRGVIARPYLRTFLDYVLHPNSPYELAIWTFAGREWGIAHLRFLKMDQLFLDDNRTQPLLAPGICGFWGYEDSGLDREEMMKQMSPGVKDLNLMWDMLNDQKIPGTPQWSPLNSFLLDDQDRNARVQPDNLIRPPVYRDTTDNSGVVDDFLLQLIGALDELAHESNVASAIRKRGWNQGIPVRKQAYYLQKGERVCQELGIQVDTGKASRVNLDVLKNFNPSTVLGMPHDRAPDATDRKGRVSVDALRGCCQGPPSSLAVTGSGPTKDAEDIATEPTSSYDRIVSQPSKRMARPQNPLIVLDLDGTLYGRPPCHLDPTAPPTPRPYLCSFLTWLLRPASLWTVAIWTSSTRATAVRCLSDLRLGIVGKTLVGKRQEDIDILAPKLVAVWTREDLGLSSEDFDAYVGVTKDLDSLWDHLDDQGVGEWSPFNTVMIDVDPNKFRAQPQTLIRAPMFDHADDSFLLQLVSMLDELAYQSNFASYISTKKWYVNAQMNEAQYVKNGLEILHRDNVTVDAGASGPIQCPPHERRIPYMVGDSIVAPPVSAGPSSGSLPLSSTLNNLQTSLSNITPLAVTRTASLEVAPPTSTPLTPTSVTSDTDSEPEADTDTPVPTFVEEEEERARLRKAPLPRATSPRERLELAVDDWYSEVQGKQREADAVPLTNGDPYDYGWQAYRRDEWDPNDDDD